MQYITEQCSIVHHRTVQHSASPHSAVKCITTQCSTVHHRTVQYSSSPHSAVQCSWPGLFNQPCAAKPGGTERAKQSSGKTALKSPYLWSNPISCGSFCLELSSPNAVHDSSSLPNFLQVTADSVYDKLRMFNGQAASWAW